MKLKSVKLEKAPMSDCCPYPESPEYPYGLKLHLDEATLQKLGIKDLPAIRSTLKIEAVVMVCEASSNESLQGEYRSLSLQITDMGIENDK